MLKLSHFSFMQGSYNKEFVLDVHGQDWYVFIMSLVIDRPPQVTVREGVASVIYPLLKARVGRLKMPDFHFAVTGSFYCRRIWFN